ncbi:50S ribosomal protein L1 [Endomicrobiia bacterium]|uniref:Large ribosomal subunit protein uL1 n=1 Tax=Endomicrobium trichonymphae TaxID=1408204 RepID=B1GZN3_ENDTX|nr:50S ribosomal protein L1 [Candidatus Endomicrobium trichonymphae]GHT07272.1 50S ribosomal protein L1 [Endomicrobiia bacterium]BAG13715.1 50S ribosomal protein L1 [Candidatus Endomicrobium trichonymphae]BAV58786.1 50S ribosomal protein L1 [Candidatus Endomicrobium trichonymphae]GHT12679.1 50S ribosomal protein L1 [Endomicrobiia bacterium]GHT18007.1 50S ribosomal protein L1 [Endomicrobiia bacterium]
MGKRLSEASKLVDKNMVYKLTEAVILVKETAKAKFDETIEIHIKLGIDPKRSDQMVRGTISIPHGIGRTRKIAVLAKGEKQKEAEAAGADIIGSDDLIEDISKGKLGSGFDVLVATPDVMKDLSRVAKILGPKGLMPNPKSGTVTFEIGKTVEELKKGRVEYKNDSFGIIHVPVGKASFEKEKLENNIKTLLEAVAKAKPLSSKGQYIKSISISSTMGPGIFVEQKI